MLPKAEVRSPKSWVLNSKTLITVEESGQEQVEELALGQAEEWEELGREGGRGWEWDLEWDLEWGQEGGLGSEGDQEPLGQEWG